MGFTRNYNRQCHNKDTICFHNNLSLKLAIGEEKFVFFLAYRQFRIKIISSVKALKYPSFDASK